DRPGGPQPTRPTPRPSAVGQRVAIQVGPRRIQQSAIRRGGCSVEKRQADHHQDARHARAHGAPPGTKTAGPYRLPAVGFPLHTSARCLTLTPGIVAVPTTLATEESLMTLSRLARRFVRPTVEILEARQLLATFTVTTTAHPGPAPPPPPLPD